MGCSGCKIKATAPKAAEPTLLDAPAAKPGGEAAATAQAAAPTTEVEVKDTSKAKEEATVTKETTPAQVPEAAEANEGATTTKETTPTQVQEAANANEEAPVTMPVEEPLAQPIVLAEPVKAAEETKVVDEVATEAAAASGSVPEAGATCVSPGCNKPSWNRQLGQKCSATCIGGASCLTLGCGKPSWNHQPGQKCSAKCGSCTTLGCKNQTGHRETLVCSSCKEAEAATAAAEAEGVLKAAKAIEEEAARKAAEEADAAKKMAEEEAATKKAAEDVAFVKGEKVTHNGKMGTIHWATGRHVVVMYDDGSKSKGADGHDGPVPASDVTKLVTKDVAFVLGEKVTHNGKTGAIHWATGRNVVVMYDDGSKSKGADGHDGPVPASDVTKLVAKAAPAAPPLSDATPAVAAVLSEFADVTDIAAPAAVKENLLPPPSETVLHHSALHHPGVQSAHEAAVAAASHEAWPMKSLSALLSWTKMSGKAGN